MSHQWKHPIESWPWFGNECTICGAPHPLDDPDLLVECDVCSGRGELIYEDMGMSRCSRCAGTGVIIDPLYVTKPCIVGLG